MSENIRVMVREITDVLSSKFDGGETASLTEGDYLNMMNKLKKIYESADQPNTNSENQAQQEIAQQRALVNQHRQAEQRALMIQHRHEMEIRDRFQRLTEALDKYPEAYARIQLVLNRNRKNWETGYSSNLDLTTLKHFVRHMLDDREIMEECINAVKIATEPREDVFLTDMLLYHIKDVIPIVIRKSNITKETLLRRCELVELYKSCNGVLSRENVDSLIKKKIQEDFKKFSKLVSEKSIEKSGKYWARYSVEKVGLLGQTECIFREELSTRIQNLGNKLWRTKELFPAFKLEELYRILRIIVDNNSVGLSVALNFLKVNGDYDNRGKAFNITHERVNRRRCYSAEFAMKNIPEYLDFQGYAVNIQFI